MLRAYEAYLIKKGTVNPQSVPYYLKWVSDCYSFLNEPLSNRLGAEQKKHFFRRWRNDTKTGRLNKLTLH